jgi:prevent-host-death family protein
MEISAKEARNMLSSLLKKVEEAGEIVIVKRGKKVTHLTAAENRMKRLPSLTDFRAWVKIKGAILGAVVSREREEAWY